MALPQKRMLREKHVYSVTDVKMHWQPSGDYLCCKVSRKKAKKTLSTIFLIFRMRGKDIPIEELELTDTIHAFAWEPRGSKFAIAHGETAGGRVNVSFYNLTKKKVELMKTLESRSCNGLFWSPAGIYCILAGFGANNGGVLEFVDTTNVQSVVTTDHYQVTDVEWSPCGRYAMTASVQPIDPGPNFKATIENGYKLWTMQGRALVQNKPIEQLYQVLWRPRPPSTLSKEAKDEKYLRDKYWDRFAKVDADRRMEQMSDEAKRRQALKEEWKAIRNSHLNDYMDEAPFRADLRGGLLSDEEEDFVMIETVVEDEVSRTEEIISNRDYNLTVMKDRKEQKAAQEQQKKSAAPVKLSKEDDD
jgi:translation initiation factor 3 subunit B